MLRHSFLGITCMRNSQGTPWVVQAAYWDFHGQMTWMTMWVSGKTRVLLNRYAALLVGRFLLKAIMRVVRPRPALVLCVTRWHFSDNLRCRVANSDFKASVYEDIIDDTFTQSRVSCSQQCDKPNASQPLRGWNSSDTGWSLCDSNVALINVLVYVAALVLGIPGALRFGIPHEKISEAYTMGCPSVC
ncbi:hypothetical protein CEXT_354401 [Caerostris extrusa]|uniref:Uncharacterized protein n=1 Tax=Caerostris extrusa TaxID=172846 RepID=A0AAV4Y2F0_CAEEX|nr:hypothetical protein CEXT_354401 [Caerostris extrusa]